MAVLNFNAEEVAPRTATEALPEGSYKVAIAESENKATKDGQGSYLMLTLQVLEGEHKGRKLFDRLNLDNRNQVAVEIARATLSSICHAVKVMQPRDSSELHSLPMIAVVKCRKREDTGDISNEVKGYKSLAEAAARPVAVAAGGARKPF